MAAKLQKYLPTFLFLAFIGVLSLLFFVLPKEDYSSTEKRKLEAAPEFSWKSLGDGSLGKSIESYLSDHFPARSFFVGLNAYANLYTGRNGASEIYQGKDGYLISAPVSYTQETLENNISRFQAFSEAAGLPAQFLLVPSTGYIMRGQLPDLHLPYDDDNVFDGLLQQQSGPLQWIDLRPLFLAHKDTTQLYYKTDHHLTAAGAYLVYQAYCEAAGLPPVPEASFTKEAYPDFYGTTYSRSGLWFTKPDQIELWRQKDLSVSVIIEDSGKSPVQSDSLFFEDHLEEADKYPVYLDGNHSLVKIRNERGNGQKLLIIKDSFAHCLATFLASNYSEIYMVDLRYYRLPVSELLQQEEIDSLLFVYGVDNLVTDTNTAWLK